MTLRGVGDRWLAGEQIEGVSFQRHDAVEISAGKHAGKSGHIELLMDVEPEARYLVKLRPDGRLAPVSESALRKAPAS